MDTSTWDTADLEALAEGYDLMAIHRRQQAADDLNEAKWYEHAAAEIRQQIAELEVQDG